MRMGALTRTELPGAVDNRLFFAQVREDPMLELHALQAHLDGPIAVVSSGGCTALSLRAAGATEVIGIDLNRSQNHLVELKAAAVSRLGPRRATTLLGGLPELPATRLRQYERLRADLTLGARRYWDDRPGAVASGVLGAGATEKFLRGAFRAFRIAVHPKRKWEQLLALETLAEQRDFYDREWNSARWRRMFDVLFNKLTMNKTYDPAFFAHVGEVGFAGHFRQLAEHTLTELPVRDNYFLHYLLLGRFPAEEVGGLPPYLSSAPAPGTLQLVDGAFQDYLRTCPDNHLTGFALSNICEWLDPDQIDDLFAEVVRTAKPGARLVFRNFVGWTEVPQRWRTVVHEDRELGDKLIRTDRSLAQRRIAVCDIRKDTES